jgi:hypothetical protein
LWINVRGFPPPPPTCSNKLEKSTPTFHIVPKWRMKGPWKKIKQICQMCNKRSCTQIKGTILLKIGVEIWNSLFNYYYSMYFDFLSCVPNYVGQTIMPTTYTQKTCHFFKFKTFFGTLHNLKRKMMAQKLAMIWFQCISRMRNLPPKEKHKFINLCMDMATWVKL